MPAQTRPATDRQINFLRSLYSERKNRIDALATGTDRLNAKAAWVLHVVDHADHCPPSSVATSQAIDWLLSLPRDPRPETASAPTTAQVEGGNYALVGTDGAVSFYRVSTPTEGRWAGFTFVDRYASDDRIPVRDRAEKSRILSAIAADVMGARTLYGQEIGRCSHCNRTLTDETSRLIGIGPDCCDALGIDRAAYQEEVINAQAERLAETSTVEELRSARDRFLATTVVLPQTPTSASGEDDGIASYERFSGKTESPIPPDERAYQAAWSAA